MPEKDSWNERERLLHRRSFSIVEAVQTGGKSYDHLIRLFLRRGAKSKYNRRSQSDAQRDTHFLAFPHISLPCLRQGGSFGVKRIR